MRTSFPRFEIVGSITKKNLISAQISSRPVTSSSQAKLQFLFIHRPLIPPSEESLSLSLFTQIARSSGTGGPVDFKHDAAPTLTLVRLICVHSSSSPSLTYRSPRRVSRAVKTRRPHLVETGIVSFPPLEATSHLHKTWKTGP